VESAGIWGIVSTAIAIRVGLRLPWALGSIVAWIPAADLAQNRFDRVWTILQCC
jgi:hypothetical protein